MGNCIKCGKPTVWGGGQEVCFKCLPIPLGGWTEKSTQPENSRLLTAKELAMAVRGDWNVQHVRVSQAQDAKSYASGLAEGEKKVISILELIKQETFSRSDLWAIAAFCRVEGNISPLLAVACISAKQEMEPSDVLTFARLLEKYPELASKVEGGGGNER